MSNQICKYSSAPKIRNEIAFEVSVLFYCVLKKNCQFQQIVSIITQPYTCRFLSIFDCFATFRSLPVRSGFEELFPVRTFLTVSQSHDALNTDDVKRIT